MKELPRPIQPSFRPQRATSRSSRRSACTATRGLLCTPSCAQLRQVECYSRAVSCFHVSPPAEQLGIMCMAHQKGPTIRNNVYGTPEMANNLDFAIIVVSGPM